MEKIIIKNVQEVEVVEDFASDSKYVICKSDLKLDINDGYHTFEELYEHRFQLFIALCRATKALDNSLGMDQSVWRSKKHSDGELAFGGTWFVMGINFEPGKQITYHLPIEKWEDTNFAPELDQAPEWDKHTSLDVLERLKAI